MGNAPEAANAQTGTVVAVAAREAVVAMLEGHPDISIVRESERWFALEIAKESARLWTPVLKLDAGYARTRRPTELASQSPSGTVEETDWNLVSAVAGRLPTGTRYELRWEGRQDRTNPAGDLYPLSPLNRSRLSLALVQPLLRGRSLASNLAPIRVAQRNAAAAGHDVRATIERLVAEVLEHFHVWVGAREELAIRSEAVRLAEKHGEATALKIRAGALSELEKGQADAQVAARRSELTTAQSQALEAERELLRRTFLHKRPGIGWQTVFVPAGPLQAPAPPAALPELDDSVRRAMEGHPAIRAGYESVRAQELAVAAAKDDRLVQLDLRAEAGGTGLAGRPNQGDGTATVSPQPVWLLGDFSDAARGTLGARGRYVSIGVTLEIPLGGGERQAAFAQAEAELAKRRAVLERTRMEVALATRSAVLQLRNAYERWQQGYETVRLAEFSLEAENRKFRGGVATPYDLFRVQGELAVARLALTRALVDLNVSHVRLHLQRGTLLEHFAIEPQGGPGGGPR